ncbi:hypothetical protein FE241_03640 [Raoultella terrigena]|nr:hypothetical protein [Raoultella terrigena]HCR57735.1 hypothetical protein [Raoultella sp.]
MVYADSSAETTVSPFSISLYNYVHIATIVHFRNRIAKIQGFALMSVSLSGSEHRLLGVDRLL